MIAILDAHFSTLSDQDAIDLGDGYSCILKPSASITSELFASGGAVKWRHINYFTFKSLVKHMETLQSPPIIIETGSSAYGTNSSVLFARLASAFGGDFATVDINPDTTAHVQSLIKDININGSCHCGDSVCFLQNYKGSPCNVVYLDSFDLDAHQFDASAKHGLAEFEALIPILDKKQAFILVDDTPCSREIFRRCASPTYLASVDAHLLATGRLPGKGELIVEAIRGDARFTILAWQYQLLLRYSCADS